MLRFVAALAVLVACCQGQWEPPESNGHAIVHLFEWKWEDVARECVEYLGPKGFGGVQLSPANEYVVIRDGKIIRPWWERYQPVSYWTMTRSGSQEQFESMVKTCNQVGVRIYVDAVINHMTGEWPEGTVGSGGVAFDSAAQSYPGVPYTVTDFNDGNCNTPSGSIEDFDDVDQIRNCKLLGLNDLDHSSDYVQQKVVDLLNMYIYFGVAGFRIDASKHMWPEQLKSILDNVDDLNPDYFGTNSRPFVYQEVIDFGDDAVSSEEYTGNGRVTEFKYGKSLSDIFSQEGEQTLSSLSDFGETWGLTERESALVFIDNHDNQRGHGAGYNILTFRDAKLYRMANAFMLAWPYGYPRIMSSFYWEQEFVEGVDVNDWVGPAMDENEDIISPVIQPDGSCDSNWVCEHRWPEIANMVEFRNAVHGTGESNWWDNGNNQIAFCRGTRGFIVFNNDDADLNETLDTCLSAGDYCDVISGSLVDGACTGKTVTVNEDGTADFEILTTDPEGVIALHANAKL